MPTAHSRIENEGAPRLKNAPTAVNGLFAIADQFLVSGTRFLITVLIAKAGGESVLGVYALVLTVVFFALMIQQTLITTPFANFRNRMNPEAELQYLQNSWWLSVFLAVFAGSVIAIFGLVFSMFASGNSDAFSFWGRMSVALLYASAAVPFLLFGEFFRRVWLIRTRAIYAFIQDGVISVVAIATLTYLFFTEQLNECWVFLTIGAINLIVVLAVFKSQFPVVSFSVSGVMTTFQNHWNFGKWIFSSEAMIYGRGNLIKWMIGGFLGIGATGFYSACDSLMRAINPFFLGVANVAEPTIAAGYADAGRKEVRRIALKVLAIIVLGTFPVCVGIGVCSRFLLLNLYGPEFAEYSIVVCWLAAAAFASTSGYPFGNAIQAIDRPEINFRIRLFTFCLVIAASLVAIPLWGLAGVAVTVFLGALVSLSLRIYFFIRFFGSKRAAAFKPVGMSQ